MPDRVRFDYGNMMAPRLDGRGLDPERLEAVAGPFRDVHAAAAAERAAGRLGFFELPDRTEDTRAILDFAHRARGRFQDLVVLGIGGSALGTSALGSALLDPFRNELNAAAREGRPKLRVLDNIDPTTIAALLRRLDPARTLVNVVSKSGTTAETAAQFLILRRWLKDALGDAHRDHLVFTTDPERGVLRQIAEDQGIAAFPVPAAVGGRFSVLSAVGMLPAALVGIDIEACLAGARAMVDRCAVPDLADNPAALFAALQYLADTDRAAPIHVMMAYSDRLLGMADWFRQLWAESLGKRVDRQGREVFRGPTPVKALGATDQHSQVQLYMEGPFDKTVAFLAVRDRGLDLEIPPADGEAEALAYLGSRSLGVLLDAERVATAAALTQAGRMNMTIELSRVSPAALGQLFMMLQIATVYAGAFYDVDPLDQPGVEYGKTVTYALLGRPGFGAPALPEPDPRWIVE